jgi:hypothetical protein
MEEYGLGMRIGNLPNYLDVGERSNGKLSESPSTSSFDIYGRHQILFT